MKLPEKLKVGGRIYDVSTDGSHDVELAHNCHMGETDHMKAVISIGSEYSDAQKRGTMIHEMLHAIANHTNLDTAWADNGEDYIERLEAALSMVFMDNPDLVFMLLPEEG